jgi:hypothetical protein
MQQIKTSAGVQADRFDLKNVSVDLIPQSPRSERAFLSIDELEAMRTERPAVPASKHALEIICGASCETGAF